MSDDIRLTFRRGDLLAILLVALLAAACMIIYIPESSAPGAALVLREGELMYELPLDIDAEVEICGEYTNTVTVLDGRVSVTASDCPGEDCVHSGWISSAGRSLVCLPNRVEVRISGASQVDFTVR